MKRFFQKLGIMVLPFIFAPALCSAAASNRTITGVVVRVYNNQIAVSTTSGAAYTAEVSQASLLRKNGSSMKLEEVLPGDKLEIRGMVWMDNSISASQVRNLSLYVHTGSFNGKIISIDPSRSGFTMQGRQCGTQSVSTDSFTSYKKNTSSAIFKDLEYGMTVSVKGVWDRSCANMAAKEVKATVRLINIEFTGRVVIKGETALTVVGDNNVIYGVDTTSTKFLSKNGKSLNAGEIRLGDIVRVQGKHVSEGVQITASQVRDTGISK